MAVDFVQHGTSFGVPILFSAELHTLVTASDELAQVYFKAGEVMGRKMRTNRDDRGPWGFGHHRPDGTWLMLFEQLTDDSIRLSVQPTLSWYDTSKGEEDPDASA